MLRNGSLHLDCFSVLAGSVRQRQMKHVFASRAWVSIITVGLLAAAVVAVYGVVRFGWRYGLPTHDKTAIVNTVISACALALVGWGVIVALVAYISATAGPDLTFEISFNFSRINEPVFRATVGFPEPGDHLSVEPFKQIYGTPVLRNKSKYAARNPGVLIEFEGCGLRDPDLGAWSQVSFANMVGVTAIQWDGGLDYIIHGRWRRTLPPLSVRGLAAYHDDPQLVVSVVADGFDPRIWKIPIRILNPAEYDKYMKRLVAAANEKNPLPAPPPPP